MAADTEPARAKRYAGLSGVAVAVLFGVGNLIWAWDMPEDGTPAAEVVEFYRDTADRIVIGGSLSLLAIAAALLFAAALRRVLIDAGGDDVLATTAFGGVLLALAAGLGAETINLVAALRARDDELNEALAQSLFEIPQILGATATGVGLGVFALATAAVALRTGAVLPRWAALVTLVAGIVLLSPLSHVNWLPGTFFFLLPLMIGVLLMRPSGARSPRAAAPPHPTP